MRKNSDFVPPATVTGLTIGQRADSDDPPPSPTHPRSSSPQAFRRSLSLLGNAQKTPAFREAKGGLFYRVSRSISVASITAHGGDFGEASVARDARKYGRPDHKSACGLLRNAVVPYYACSDASDANAISGIRKDGCVAGPTMWRPAVNSVFVVQSPSFAAIISLLSRLLKILAT